MTYGSALRAQVAHELITPFLGIYDVFSATLAAEHYNALFVSGFGFAASYYGLPDIGFIAWPDIISLVQRIRTVLPRHHLLVDIDDGYCDVEVACHVVSLLESAGASGVVLEDQQRPRKCGHFDGKLIMPLNDYLEKLNRVLGTRRDLFVIARTDTSDPEDAIRRVQAYAEAGADAVLVDGLRNLELLPVIKRCAGKPVTFNQIAGGKSPMCTLSELSSAGVSLVIYSTPCLFATQDAIQSAMHRLKMHDGTLTAQAHAVDIKQCTAMLSDNLQRRYRP